jgi:hypothetical protein
MSNEQNSNIVPFGKYKGQSIETILADPGYKDWLLAQDWFRDRFANLYQVIINYNQPPADTPEHNILQAQFLNDGVCKRLAALAGIEASEITDRQMEEFCDVTFKTGVLGKSFMVELKPIIGDDYPTILRQMKEQLRRAVVGIVEPGIVYKVQTSSWQAIRNHAQRYGFRQALVFQSFNAAGVSLDQVKTIFAQSGIVVVQIDELR